MHAQILRTFKGDLHPNIVHFSDFIITPSYAIVVMDYHAKLMPVQLGESRARPYLSQILSAVEYLHGARARPLHVRVNDMD